MAMKFPSALLYRLRIKAPASPPHHSDMCHSFYEYQWDGPEWRDNQPIQTTLFVVFEREAAFMFSTVQVLLYFNQNISTRHFRPDAWDIREKGSATITHRGVSEYPLPNDLALPRLTIVFELVRSRHASATLESATMILRDMGNDCVPELRKGDISTCIVFEREFWLNPDISSLSLCFTHTTMLNTAPTPSLGEWRIGDLVIGYQNITTRFVRVIPPQSVHPKRKATAALLPNVLLLKIFDDSVFSHNDLLSFAQVCSAWGHCAMQIYQSRMIPSEYLLDVHLLAKVVQNVPTLGRYFRSLMLVDLMCSRSRCTLSKFTSATLTILRTTKNLESLHLVQFDPSQANALIASLRDLHQLHTFIIGWDGDTALFPGVTNHLKEHPHAIPDALRIPQLMRSMRTLPALRTLEVRRMQPGTLGIQRLILCPPRCPLTQLTLSRFRISDADLKHLFTLSAGTLKVVTLDRLLGITNGGLLAFLRAISQTVVSLTLHYIGVPVPGSRMRVQERALDVVVQHMQRLHELHIWGEMATELMLVRRSIAFTNSCHIGDSDGQANRKLPVVQIWETDCFELTGLYGLYSEQRWPGWRLMSNE